MDPFSLGKTPAALVIYILYVFGAKGVEMLMEHDGVKNLMSSGEKFDVCLLETFNVDALVVKFD